MFSKLKKGPTNVIDMTQGNPYKLIFMFSIPMLIGNIFQQLYNMVDCIVVGNYVGEKALAGVGTGFPVIFMLSSFFIGVGAGATVMISQYFGAKDFDNITKTVSTMYTSMMIGSIPLALVGILASKPLLLMMNVPHDGTFEMAHTYMVVIFAGMICTLGFNVNAGILQGLGDTRTSLLFLLVATIINIVLDILFTVFFGWGVMGAALATIIAQFCSWIFGVIFINKNYSYINIKIFSFSFDKEIFSRAMKLGIPMGIQQALFSIGMMVMNRLVISYGSTFMAGFNGANKIDTFAFMPIQSFSNAVTTYVGQNVGASKIDRVKSGTKAGLVLVVITSIIVSVLIYPFSGLLMRMFGSNPEMIEAGVIYLKTVLPFFFILGIWFIFSSVLRGAGEAIVPMIASFVGLWFARIPAAYLLAHFFGKEYMFYSYSFAWLIGMVITLLYYKFGNWREKCIIKKPSKIEE